MINFVKKLNAILNRKQRTKFGFYIVFSVIGSILELVGISLFIPFISFVLDSENFRNTVIFSKIFELFNLSTKAQIIIFLSLVLFFAYLLKNLFLCFLNYYKYSFINTTQKELYTKMISFYLNQPYIFHVYNNSATLQRNIINDCGQFIQVLQNFCDFLVNILLAGSIVGYLLYMDWQSMLLVSGIFGIIVLVFLKPYNKRLISYGRTARDCGAQLVRIINESLGGVKEIKVKSVVPYFVSYFSSVIKKSSTAQKKNSFLASLPKYVIETIVIIVLISIIVYKILIQKVSNTDFVSEMSVFAFAFIKLLPSVTSISTSFSGVCYNYPSLRALYNELTRIDETPQNEIIKTKDTKLMNFNMISLKNVSFHYPSAEKIILDKINLTLEKGKFYAFIGESGSGKTTLMDIILNLLDVTDGYVFMNDTDRNIIDKEEWFKYFGYIPQFVYLTDNSIRENIALGENAENIDDEKIRNILKIVKLDKVVEDLPNGIYESVGENGSRFSGGQRQRLGIARALYQNKQIFILDEATSALDSETENEILKIIDSFKGEKTVVMVAHKLNTIKNCDYVYEVKNGKLILQ